MKRRTVFTTLALAMVLTVLLIVPPLAFAQSSAPLPNMPTANNTVRATVPDGAGGVYIGGDFTQLTPASGPAVTRNRIARINVDGSILAWNPNASNTMYALAVSGSTVYAGGHFTNIGGQARPNFAAFGALLKTNTTTTLTCTPNPSTVGQSVTCTATVVESDPATPTGAVTFYMGGTPMVGCINVPLNASAQATCTMAPLSTCVMTAMYGGDAKFAASTSGAVTEVVNDPALAKPAEVPEADTLLLLGGGLGGLATWLGWQWRKRRAGT